MATKINNVNDLISPEEQAAIEAEARRTYEPSYNAAKNTLDQSYTSNKQAVQSALDEYLGQSEKQKKFVQDTVINSSVKRGMGRSTYTDYQLAAGLGDLADQIAAYQKQAGQQLVSLESTYQTNLGQLNADKEANILNRMAELKAQAIENAKWLAEFNLAAGGSGGGGGGSKSSTPILDLSAPATGMYTGTSAGKSYVNGVRIPTIQYNTLVGDGSPVSKPKASTKPKTQPSLGSSFMSGVISSSAKPANKKKPAMR